MTQLIIAIQSWIVIFDLSGLGKEIETNSEQRNKAPKKEKIEREGDFKILRRWKQEEIINGEKIKEKER